MPCECTEYKVEECFAEFWMVIGSVPREQLPNAGGLPTYRHQSLESARKEAARLANANPCITFYVLHTVAACRKSDVNWLRPLDKDLMPPF